MMTRLVVVGNDGPQQGHDEEDGGGPDEQPLVGQLVVEFLDLPEHPTPRAIIFAAPVLHATKSFLPIQLD